MPWPLAVSLRFPTSTTSCLIPAGGDLILESEKGHSMCQFPATQRTTEKDKERSKDTQAGTAHRPSLPGYKGLEPIVE